MRVIADRVMETTETTGVGALSLAGAKTGYQGFVAGAGDGAEVYYCIAGQPLGPIADEWEVGIGTVTDAAPDTLSRDTVLASSNGGAAVNFSVGTKDVFLTLPAQAPVVHVEVLEPSAVASLSIDISGFESVRLVGWLKPATDQVTPMLRFSNDGGSTFEDGAAYYTWTAYYQVMDVVASGLLRDDADSEIELGENCGNDTEEMISFDLLIVNPADASVYTIVMGKSVLLSHPHNYVAYDHWGSVKGTAEVNNAVQFLFSAGNIADGRVSVYGYPAAE